MSLFCFLSPSPGLAPSPSSLQKSFSSSHLKMQSLPLILSLSSYYPHFSAPLHTTLVIVSPSFPSILFESSLLSLFSSKPMEAVLPLATSMMPNPMVAHLSSCLSIFQRYFAGRAFEKPLTPGCCSTTLWISGCPLAIVSPSPRQCLLLCLLSKCHRTHILALGPLLP